MKPKLAFFSVLVVCMNLICLQSSAGANEAIVLMKQAAESYTRGTRGIIGYCTITDTHIKSSMFNQESHTESYVAARDGILIRTSLEKMLINGKNVTKKQLKDQETKTNEAIQKGQSYVKMPYDPQYLDEYTFSLGEAAGNIPAGTKVIHFSSPRKDEQHGSGDVLLDKKFQVLAVEFTPNKMPDHVSHCALHFECGTVAPGIFGIRTMQGDYQGRYGLISGSFTLKQYFEGYQRYKTIEEALSR